jgi:integrase
MMCCSWRTIKDITADSFCAWRRTQKVRAKTLNEYLNAISVLLNGLVNRGRIPGNPLAFVQRIHNHEDAKLVRRALTLDEARRLISAGGERTVLYWVAMRTGFRRNELAQLHWQDFHLDGLQSFISARASTTKNHKAAPIPIDDELAAALRAVRPPNCRPDDRLFRRVPLVHNSGPTYAQRESNRSTQVEDAPTSMLCV